MQTNTANRMPESMKVATTTNEIQRRMRNTSRDLPHQVLDQVLKNYMDELKLGGYSHQWRVNALDAATKGFCKIWAKEKTGRGKINRPGHMGSTGTRFKRLCGKTTWFQDKNLQPKPAGEQNEDRDSSGRRTGPKKHQKYTESVLFIPYTPGGALKKEIQELENRFNVKKYSGKTK